VRCPPKQSVFVPLMLMRKVFIILFSLCMAAPVFCQSKTDTAKVRGLIQFSGVVVESDSLKPLPFSKIFVNSVKGWVISDVFAYFSFVALEGDTVVFQCVGYRKSRFVIPDTLSTNKYSLIQVLHSDTITLPNVFIYPWPTKEQFREAFLKLNIPDDDLERAKKNLARAELKEQYQSLPLDASMSYKLQTQENNTRLYYAGQYPPNNLLNPIAWAKFIQAWKNGEYKRKDKKDE